MPGKAFKTKGTYLTAIMADETTVTGFLLTGMGERKRTGDKDRSNFFVVGKDTTDAECENMLKDLLSRNDVGIIMVAQNVAERVKHVIEEHQEVIPTILEIPSKDQPYDPEKDTIVVRAAQILWGSDTGLEKLREIANKNPAAK